MCYFRNRCGENKEYNNLNTHSMTRWLIRMIRGMTKRRSPNVHGDFYVDLLNLKEHKMNRDFIDTMYSKI